MADEALSRQIDKLDLKLDNLSEKIASWQQENVTKIAVLEEKDSERAKDVDNLANAVRDRDVKCRKHESVSIQMEDKIKVIERNGHKVDEWKEATDTLIKKLQGFKVIAAVASTILVVIGIFYKLSEGH